MLRQCQQTAAALIRSLRERTLRYLKYEFNKMVNCLAFAKPTDEDGSHPFKSLDPDRIRVHDYVLSDGVSLSAWEERYTAIVRMISDRGYLEVTIVG